jgi:hypothetical protein
VECTVDAVVRTHLLSGLERPPAREHGQAREQPAFSIRQQLVTPVDGRFQRPLPRDGRPRSARQQPEPILQPCVDLLD